MNETPKSSDKTKSAVDAAIADKLAIEEAQRKLAIQRDAEFAQKRQDEMLRKLAPGGGKLKIGTEWEDPMMDVIRTHCEPYGIKVLGKDATHTTYTDRPENHQKTLINGYIPLLNRLTNEQVRNGNDLVYYRDKRITDAVIREAAERGKALLGAPHAGMQEAARGGAGGLKVLEDETSVTKGTLAGT